MDEEKKTAGAEGSDGETMKNISVNAENIFPVIKKWLYSDKEIFLREIVSNACDAATKMKRLISLGQIEPLPEEDPFRIDVTLDKDAGTLTVSDNGVGMTREEVDTYIGSIALSGAVDFMAKYEKDAASNGIIGHFGLGFYSVFMVSDEVRVVTRSYTGAPTAVWICNEEGQYRFEEGGERERGTDVILHLSEEEGSEFLSEDRVREVLLKYCSFLPVKVFFHVLPGVEKAGENEEQAPEEAINDTRPLWLKNPSDCTEEEYSEFYKKVFGDYREPLFHIHLNADYPLNFKGILYFPRLNMEYENPEGQIKLYYNQVFVADNIKEVIPEYFFMLKGVLDCPELPLNVSRSYLQNSGYVAKISAHIVKKTADKICGMFNTDRESYEKLWKDLKLFVEYGCLRDRKFYDRVKSALLFSGTNGKSLSIEELKEEAAKTSGKIFYTTDPVSQAQYIALYASQEVFVAVTEHTLDARFLTLIEQQEGLKFLRVDAEPDELKNGESADADEALTSLLREASGKDDLDVSYAPLKSADVPVLWNVDEEGRRMNDLMKAYGMDAAGLPQKATLVVNTASPLVQKLQACGDPEKKKEAAKQLYLLALLGNRPLNAEELQQLLSHSYKMLELGL